MRIAILVAGVAAVGCASTAQLPPAGATAYGVYHFREHIPNAQPSVTVEGDIVLAPDTIIVSSSMGPCAYDARVRDNRMIRYVCGAVTFTLDRYDPLRRNSYAVRASEIVSERVCAATTMVNGVDRCTRYEERRVSREVTRFGRLELRSP